MNNYWHTNYKADQEGLVVFRYSVQPHEAFRPDVAARFGVERRQPLIAVLADPTKPPVKSLLQVSSSSVLVSSLKAIEGGKALLLYLYNPMSSDQSVRLEWNKKISVAMYRSDPFARAGDRLSDQLEIPGWGSAYLRAERK
jgi:alpha-mannosidase